MSTITLTSYSHIRNLENQIHTEESDHMAHERQVRYFRERIQEARRHISTARKSLIAAMRLNRSNSDHLKFLLRSQLEFSYSQFLSVQRSIISHHQEEIDVFAARESESTLASADAQRRLVQLRQKLALEKARGDRKTHTIDLDLVQATLESYAEVAKAEVTADAHFLTMKCHLPELIMTPPPGYAGYAAQLLENATSHRITSDDVAIPLPPMELYLRIPLQEFTHFTADLITDVNCKGMDSTYLPHPHWITDGTPCLGDFGPSVSELINSGDLATAMYMYILFLQQYHPEDTAGRYFVNWYKTAFLPETLSERDIPSLEAIYDTVHYEDEVPRNPKDIFIEIPERLQQARAA